MSVHKSSVPVFCRYCGKPIPKWTNRQWVPHEIRGQICTLADAQTLSNYRVVSISRVSNSDQLSRENRMKRHRGLGEKRADPIRCYSTWDGESYVDPFFCKGTCAKDFAYANAHAGQAMRAYNEAVARRKTK